MINRRNFLVSLAGLPMALSASELAPSAFNPVLEKANLPLTDEIRRFEAIVAANPNTFSWWAHNELRHYYL